MKKPIIVAAAAGVLALTAFVAAQQAQAHHAFAAEFDGNAPVLLKGKVTKVEWINPHAWVHMTNAGSRQAGPTVDGRGRHAQHPDPRRSDP